MLPSCPLTTDDASLTFINSSMAPFKMQLLKKERIVPQTIIQRCFRHREGSEFLYNFKMLGIIASLEFAPQIMDDIGYLFAHLPLDKERVYVVLSKEDSDLRGIVEKHFPKVIDIDEPVGLFDLRWGFGSKELSGRGLTFTYFHPDSDGVLDIEQSKPLGNLIRIDSGDTSYIEFGLGVEFLAAAIENTTLMELPFYKALTEHFPFEENKQLTKSILGALVLLSEGIVPGNKKGGYILKKLLRDVHVILSDNCTGIEGIKDCLEKFFSKFSKRLVFEVENVSARAFSQLIDHMHRIDDAMEKNVSKALTWLEKNSTVSADEKKTKLKGTFGIRDTVLPRLLGDI